MDACHARVVCADRHRGGLGLTTLLSPSVGTNNLPIGKHIARVDANMVGNALSTEYKITNLFGSISIMLGTARLSGSLSLNHISSSAGASGGQLPPPNPQIYISPRDHGLLDDSKLCNITITNVLCFASMVSVKSHQPLHPPVHTYSNTRYILTVQDSPSAYLPTYFLGTHLHGSILHINMQSQRRGTCRSLN